MTDYHALINTRLDGKRCIHSESTADEAIKLAQRYGFDTQKAYTAGLLHDLAKCLSPQEACEKAKAYGIGINEYYENNPELMHGAVGAAIAEYELHIHDEEILSAIRCHTTGKKDMSLLDKIIYMADLIEPSRNFEGIDEIRRMAYEDLDKAIVMAVRSILDYVMKRGLVIHPDTVDAYNDIIIKRRNLFGTKV